MVAHHVLNGQRRNAPPFHSRNRFGRIAKRTALPRLHLDEHQSSAVASDDVNFSEAGPVTPRNNCVPAALELTTGEIFAGFSEFDTLARHRAKRAANPTPTRVRSATNSQKHEPYYPDLD